MDIVTVLKPLPGFMVDLFLLNNLIFDCNAPVRLYDNSKAKDYFYKIKKN